MNCPRCSATLTERKLKDVEVDRCPECDGLWLDFHELDQLEDNAMDDDSLKGMMDYARRESDITCPHCGDGMETFNYRAHNLPIDRCNVGHGFWLDKGEADRVLDIMRQRTRDLRRSTSAEEQWGQFLERVGTRSFLDKIKGLFGG